jgi:alpha-methylacyl-CoA racemase
VTNGTLTGLRVLEFGSIGPGPFGAMMLADHGADVVRVDRVGEFASVTPAGDARNELLHRNRRSIALDLKDEADRATALRLIARADVLIEGNRPGVMERLGLGPDVALELNPRLIYARMTGWGQTGPLAGTVGHDVNYISTSGTLGLIGTSAAPVIPLALVGDFASGGMVMAFGVLAALHERESSGLGQVVDAAIIDGAALLATAFHGYNQTGDWSDERSDNLVDGGAPFYNVYETADHRWLSVGPLEARFYSDLLRVMELDESSLPAQNDKSSWPELRERFAGIFASATLSEWVERAEGTNACLSPVLSLAEARDNPHVVARGTILESDGLYQPAPAPRFSRTNGALRMPPPRPGEHSDSVLGDWLG